MAGCLLPNFRQGTIITKVSSKRAGKLEHMNTRFFANVHYFALAIILLSGLTACTQQQESPEQIRQQTAQATSEAKNDAKAVAEGIRDGLHRDGRLDLNSASKDQLLQLPGMSNSEADRVIAGRPYSSADDLVGRHIVSKSEYDRISDRVEVK